MRQVGKMWEMRSVGVGESKTTTLVLGWRGVLEFVGAPEISCFFIPLIRFDSEKDDKCISLNQIRYIRVQHMQGLNEMIMTVFSSTIASFNVFADVRILKSLSLRLLLIIA